MGEHLLEANHSKPTSSTFLNEKFCDYLCVGVERRQWITRGWNVLTGWTETWIPVYSLPQTRTMVHNTETWIYDLEVYYILHYKLNDQDSYTCIHIKIYKYEILWQSGISLNKPPSQTLFSILISITYWSLYNLSSVNKSVPIK